MDTGGHRAARVFHGDAPEIAHAKTERLSLRGGGVVEVVTQFVQDGDELGLGIAAQLFAQFGDEVRIIDMPAARARRMSL